jgi:hypothetical protein
VQDPVGSWQVVDLRDYVFASLIGTGSSVIRLRFGVVDERVVVKRVIDQTFSWPVALANHPVVLAPRALVAASDRRDNYAAYTFCQHGSLGEWIQATSNPDRTLTQGHVVRIMLGIAEAALALVSSGTDVSALCADEIFIDSLLQPRVRLRHDLSSRSLPLTSAAKWFSPEEAEQFSLHSPSFSTWPAAAYRIGLVMYCMCAYTPDPYPTKHVDEVICDLRGEKRNHLPAVRPDMSRVAGEQLEMLITTCLATDPYERPDHGKISQILSDMLQA